MTEHPETPPLARPRSWLRRGLTLASLVLFLPAGAAGSWGYRAWGGRAPAKSASDTERQAETVESHHVGIAHSGRDGESHRPPAPEAGDGHGPGAGPAGHSPEPVSERFERADLAIATDDWEAALRHLESSDVPDTFARSFRVALCREGQGKSDRAREAYERAIALTASPSARALAQFGLARCDVADRAWDRAEGRLRRLVLTSGEPGCRDQRVAERALTAQARVATERRGPTPAPDPFAPSAFAVPAWDEPLRNELHALAACVPGRTGSDSQVSVEIHEGRPTRVTARVPPATLTVVVRHLADSTGRQLLLSPSAHSLFDATPVELDVHALPLDLVVSQLAETVGFVVSDSAGTWELRPGPANEPRPTPVEALARARAADPTDPRPTLALGNLAVADGHLAAAAGHYQSVLNASCDSSGVTVAAYNLGLVRLRESRPRDARSAFLAVVDAAASPQWADRGRWWVARADLDASDVDAARDGFARLRSAGEPAIRSAAALGHVACAFLTGDVDRARASLPDDRFADGPHARVRQTWAAWARYRTTPTATRGDELRRAVRDLPDETVLGPTGVWLFGRALKEIGDEAGMTRMYERAATRTRGELGDRMALAVAEVLDRSDLTSAARTRLLPLATSPDPAVRSRVRLALAEIDLALGEPASSLRYLTGVSGMGEGDRERALRVKARAYEALGQFRHAAACYEGRDPGE